MACYVFDRDGRLVSHGLFSLADAKRHATALGGVAAEAPGLGDCELPTADGSEHVSQETIALDAGQVRKATSTEKSARDRAARAENMRLREIPSLLTREKELQAAAAEGVDVAAELADVRARIDGYKAWLAGT